MNAEEIRNQVVIRPSGRITAAGAEEFRRELLRHVEAGKVHIRIDLEDVDMIDSKGLAVFIVCHQTVSQKGGSLTVVTDKGDLRQLFCVMRLDQHFTVCGSTEAAPVPAVAS